MKTSILLTAGLLFYAGTNIAKAQPIFPGGIEGLAFRGIAHSIGDKFTFQGYYPFDGNTFQYDFKRGALLNFNPSLLFEDEHDRIQTPLANLDLNKMTMFTVFQPADTAIERSVWSIERSAKSINLLTTHHTADFEQNAFFNTRHEQKNAPIIHVFNQFVQQDTLALSSNTLKIGEKPAFPDIPILPFIGKFAEILLYDRVLSPSEQLQVESFLALKYGITLSLSGAHAYVDSKKEVIWDLRRFRNFSSRISGIGRDDESGLYQKQSSSSYDPELLAIGVGKVAESNAKNNSEFSDYTFLIWGDDNKTNRLKEKHPGRLQMVSRNWLITASGNSTDINTEVHYHIRRMNAPLGAGEIWWLAVDRSETGEFGVASTQYFPAAQISPTGKAVFPSVTWDADQSKYDFFTFGKGPAMMPLWEVQSPTCFPQTEGELTLKVVGGTPPYKIVLQALNTTFLSEWIITEDMPQFVNGILPGDYLIKVTDATGQVYSESFFIQSSDAPKIDLHSRYQLTPRQPLLLNAAGSNNTSNSDIEYEWSGPDDYRSTSALTTIAKAGSYSISATRSGCTARKIIHIEDGAPELIQKIELYPNPVSNGAFQLAIYLDQVSKVFVRISDAQGRDVFDKVLDGGDYYNENLRLALPAGTYTVSVFSGQTSKSLTLVVI